MGSNCSCGHGYYGINEPNACQLCPIGSYCLGGNETIACGQGATTYGGEGSFMDTNCTCIPSYYGPHGHNTCSLCTAGYYCTGDDAIVPCIANHYCPAGVNASISCGIASRSPMGSEDALNCTCEAGWHGMNGADTCEPCPPGYYCTGGDSMIACPANHFCPSFTIIPITCGVGSISLEGSGYNNNCSCSAGYFGANSNGTCQGIQYLLC
jgi:hypothetical protein